MVEAQPRQYRSLLGARPIEVELAIAFLVAACFARFGFSSRVLVASFFVAVLVVLSAIDIERRVLPNRILFPATAVVLVAQVALFPDRALEWIGAALAASLFMLLPFFASPRGLGMGDVKLAFFLGAGLGREVATALLVGTLAAALFSLALLFRKGIAARKSTIPLGPFLAFGAVVAVLLDARLF